MYSRIEFADLQSTIDHLPDRIVNEVFSVHFIGPAPYGVILNGPWKDSDDDSTGPVLLKLCFFLRQYRVLSTMIITAAAKMRRK